MPSRSARQIRSADKVPNPEQCGLHYFILRGALRHNSFGSLQRRQPRLGNDGGVILHLDEAQLDQRSQIVVPHWRQLEPISNDVAKGPAKPNGLFEIKICKRSFHPDVEMNNPPIGSAEDEPVRQTADDVDPGRGKLCKDAAAEMW